MRGGYEGAGNFALKFRKKKLIFSVEQYFVKEKKNFLTENSFYSFSALRGSEGPRAASPSPPKIGICADDIRSVSTADMHYFLMIVTGKRIK